MPDTYGRNQPLMIIIPYRSFELFMIALAKALGIPLPSYYSGFIRHLHNDSWGEWL